MAFRIGNLRVFMCGHVFRCERPVLLVVREEGDWVFACGNSDHAQDASEWRVVGIGHLTERDGSLHLVSDLPDGWQAERMRPDAPWGRSPLE
jgi:hypothetical protein